MTLECKTERPVGNRETEDRVRRSKLSAIEFPDGTKEDREELILKKQQGNSQNWWKPSDSESTMGPETEKSPKVTVMCSKSRSPALGEALDTEKETEAGPPGMEHTQALWGGSTVFPLTISPFFMVNSYRWLSRKILQNFRYIGELI